MYLSAFGNEPECRKAPRGAFLARAAAAVRGEKNSLSPRRLPHTAGKSRMGRSLPAPRQRFGEETVFHPGISPHTIGKSCAGRLLSAPRQRFGEETVFHPGISPHTIGKSRMGRSLPAPRQRFEVRRTAFHSGVCRIPPENSAGRVPRSRP